MSFLRFIESTRLKRLEHRIVRSNNASEDRATSNVSTFSSTTTSSSLMAGSSLMENHSSAEQSTNLRISSDTCITSQLSASMIFFDLIHRKYSHDHHVCHHSKCCDLRFEHNLVHVFQPFVHHQSMYQRNFVYTPYNRINYNIDSCYVLEYLIKHATHQHLFPNHGVQVRIYGRSFRQEGYNWEIAPGIPEILSGNLPPIDAKLYSSFHIDREHEPVYYLERFYMLTKAIKAINCNFHVCAIQLIWMNDVFMKTPSFDVSFFASCKINVEHQDEDDTLAQVSHHQDILMNIGCNFDSISIKEMLTRHSVANMQRNGAILLQ